MIKRFFSNWQGLTALIVSVVVFWFSSDVIHRIDSTAGTFDLGYVQRPIVAACYFLFGTFIVFTAIWIDFPTIDKWIDRGFFRDAWNDGLSERDKILFSGVLFIALFFAFLVCLLSVPV